MISIPDLIFLTGIATALTGCWLLGVLDFMIGCGVVVCLTGVVVQRQLAR